LDGKRFNGNINKMKKASCLSVLLLFLLGLSAQSYHDYGFSKDISIPVFRSDSTLYRYAWAGGINNVQVGWVDCNRDGKKDLIAFEVQGGRILPFVWQDTAYVYCPQYAVYFPQMQGFMQLIDFDGDGKEDIFTYQTAGVKVYRNVSDSVLKFALFTEQLLSTYYESQNPINLFCTDGDYIAIADMDGDGDMDILTFGPLGKYVEYHRNMSVERYGNAEHLEYKLESHCWGKFSESNENNDIKLDDDCGLDSPISPQKQHRHAGSSMLLFDENGNGLQDLLLGDKDYPSLVLLANGGTANEAYITQKTEFFPAYNVPLNLYSKPVAMYIDVDRDGVKDLLASPFDLELVKSENKESLWFYKNIGTTQNPVFALKTKSFLQEDMLDFGSGAFPLLYDVDGDGLTDMLVGNYGYYDSTTLDGYGNIKCHYSASVAFFKNIGTPTQPQFMLVTEDLGGLRSKGFLSLVPAMGDLNGDGKADILIAASNGELIYLENKSVGGNLSFANPVFKYKSLILNEFAAVQLFDLDKDGLVDLIAGSKRGTLQFYKNKGTAASPNFVLQKDTLGGIIVRDYDMSYFGYATPFFFRTNTGETRLMVASEKGTIAYYKLIDNNLYGNFQVEIADLFFMQNRLSYPIREGIRTALSLSDVDNDGYLDMVVGNYAGGLSFYKGITPPDRTVSVPQNKPQTDNSIRVYPNPVNYELKIKNYELKENTVIEIYNVVGQKVGAYPCGRPETTINVQHLPNGMYFIKIGNMTARFVKY
jgi:hypothetical protein